MASPARQREERLEQYLATEVLRDDRFVGSQFPECRASRPGVYHEGQLHHVRRHYDLTVDGAALRVAVVGKSYGHGPSRFTKGQRYRLVVETGAHKRFGMGKNSEWRNPHMNGTTSLLRLLFGIPLGVDHASEYLQLHDGTQSHLFDAFALLNYLMCSALVFEGSTRDRSSAIMRLHCGRHVRSTLEILEPTLVVD